jgi:hypothetical protein
MALTEKQKIFVDVFCEAISAGVSDQEAFNTAKMNAGYADSTVKRDIFVDEVLTEVQAYYNRVMVSRLGKAFRGLDSLLDEPDQKGAAVLLATVNSVFDRGGLIKKESKEITVKSPTGIVVMPSKAELDPE